MAANTVPIFVLTPKEPKTRIATLNTGRDGTGTLGTLTTAGANGAFYKGIRWQAEVTTTAGVIRIFIQTAGAGNFELIKEMLVPAVTPGVTIEAASGEWYPTAGIVLGAGDLLCASTQIAETFSVWAMGGGDY
jgi:hypothetical protein